MVTVVLMCISLWVMMLTTLLCAFGHFCIFFGELFRLFAHFLIWLPFCYWIVGVLIHFWYYAHTVYLLHLFYMLSVSLTRQAFICFVSFFFPTPSTVPGSVGAQHIFCWTNKLQKTLRKDLSHQKLWYNHVGIWYGEEGA